MPPGQERTEKPSPKKKQEARKQGKVARSSELGGWLSVLTFIVLLPSLGGRAVRMLSDFMTQTVQNIPSASSPDDVLAVLGKGLWTLVEAAGPLLAVSAAVAVVAGFGQVGLRFAPGALGVKFSKVSPMAGVKRIFSPNGVWELGKQLLRLMLLAGVGYMATKSLIVALVGGGTLPLGSTLALASGGMLGLVRNVSAVALVVGLGDYAFQRHRLNTSMKMTKQELKQEAKDQEGSPEVRREIRRRRRRLSRMQIAAAVANASVVVVNPTHVAVALAYDRSRDRAPRLLAKGEDELALAIRVEALTRRVPIVENPPLARAIAASCEVNAEIPPRLYDVVAKLLAFVYRLSPAARDLVEVHHWGLGMAIPGWDSTRNVPDA